jgi:uncharacterized membrane protein YedE/YeeE
MLEVLKSLGIGVAAYILCAAGIWFALSLLVSLSPIGQSSAWVIPAAMALIPLFVTGFVTARFSAQSQRHKRVLLGVAAGLLGLLISLLTTQTQGELWVLIPVLLGAAAVAGAGGLAGARRMNAL